jgi:hypothetical protein
MFLIRGFIRGLRLFEFCVRIFIHVCTEDGPVSSNKILGMFGQEILIPNTGLPMSDQSTEFDDAIVIIVSHSGSSFAPLACSNLMQALTKSIFVVSLE